MDRENPHQDDPGTSSDPGGKAQKGKTDEPEHNVVVDEETARKAFELLPDAHPSDLANSADVDLLQHVHDKLSADPEIADDEIFVYANEGRVTIKGHVTDESMIEKAARCLAALPDMKELINELRYRG